MTPDQQLEQCVTPEAWRTARRIVKGIEPVPEVLLLMAAEGMLVQAIIHKRDDWLHAAGALKGRLIGDKKMEAEGNARYWLQRWMELRASATDRTTT